MKTLIGIAAVTLLFGIAAADAQNLEMRRNMGMRKGMGMGYPVQAPAIASSPRPAIVAGQRAPTHWSTFQTAPRRMATNKRR